MAPRSARAHLARGFAHQQEGAAHIDAHDALEIRQRRLEDRAALAQHPGAGDRHIDGAELLLRGREGIDDGLLIPGIALEGERPAAELLDALGRLGRRPRRPVEQGQIGAEIGQGQRRLQPDARAAAGDEGRLALEGEAGEGRALAHVFFPMLPLWVGAPPPGTMRRQSLPA